MNSSSSQYTTVRTRTGQFTHSIKDNNSITLCGKKSYFTPAEIRSIPIWAAGADLDPTCPKCLAAKS